MTTKRERLAIDIGRLLASHSKEDWLYVAGELERVAEIARALASKAPAKPTKRRKRASRSPKAVIRARYKPKDRLVSQFAKVLDDPEVGLTIDTVKRIAIDIGIKAELPKQKIEIEEMILRNLDQSPEKMREEKLQVAIKHLEDRQRDPSDDYQRWVNLITNKKPEP